MWGDEGGSKGDRYDKVIEAIKGDRWVMNAAVRVIRMITGDGCDTGGEGDKWGDGGGDMGRQGRCER